MRIAFICSSLESGKDGVGDYTRRLTGELIRQGHRACIIALHDKHIDNIQQEVQIVQNCKIKTLRLPSCISWTDKKKIAKEYIDEFNPEWLSLQYVPYGYHNKGLPFFLPKVLQIIGQGRGWHIMFHEIWTGISRVSSMKHKFYGSLQRYILKDIVKKIRPKLISTTNKLYQLVLEYRGLKAEIIPLFSNIPIANFENEIVYDICEKAKIQNLNGIYILGVFGTIYKNANLEIVLKKELSIVKKNNKELLFVAFGNVGTLQEYNRLSKIFDNILFVNLGILSEKKVSSVLQLIDKLISCTPKQHIGKSGVYAAASLHSKNILLPFSDPVPEYEIQIEEYNKYLSTRKPYEWDVKFIANQYIELFNFNYD